LIEFKPLTLFLVEFVITLLAHNQAFSSPPSFSCVSFT